MPGSLNPPDRVALGGGYHHPHFTGGEVVGLRHKPACDMVEPTLYMGFSGLIPSQEPTLSSRCLAVCQGVIGPTPGVTCSSKPGEGEDAGEGGDPPGSLHGSSHLHSQTDRLPGAARFQEMCIWVGKAAPKFLQHLCTKQPAPSAQPSCCPTLNMELWSSVLGGSAVSPPPSRWVTLNTSILQPLFLTPRT